MENLDSKDVWKNRIENRGKSLIAENEIKEIHEWYLRLHGHWFYTHEYTLSENLGIVYSVIIWKIEFMVRYNYDKYFSLIISQSL